MLQEKQDKFKILLLGILLVISQLVSAQNNFQREMYFGLNGGVAISSVRFNPKTYPLNACDEVELQ